MSETLFRIPEHYWPNPCPGAKYTIASREFLVEFFTPEHVAAFDRAKAEGALIPVDENEVTK